MQKIGILWLSALLLVSCSQPPAKKPIRLVRTVTVEATGVVSKYVYAGVVKARYEIPLSFQVSGKMASRLVEVGDKVKPQQLLAELDANDLKIQLHIRQQKLISAKTNLELTQAELKRYEPLVKNGYISASQLHQVRAKQETALADYNQANADLDEAERQLSYAQLYSEKAGVIIDVLASPGEVVSAGKPVLKMATTNETEIAINVPEQRIAQWQEGKGDVDVVLWAYPRKHYKAKIREIDSDTDPATRTFLVKLTIPDADAKMQLGMTANVTFAVKKSKQQIAIPLTSVFYISEQPYVWVVNPKDSTVQPQAVTLGEWADQDNYLVKSGLINGQIIVTAGVHQLNRGQEVNIMRDKPQ